MNDRMVEFRLKGPMNNRLPKVGQETAGEKVFMRVSCMMCLFPEHCQIRTVEHGWTIEVFSEDWGKVESAFRGMYLGGKRVIDKIDRRADRRRASERRAGGCGVRCSEPTRPEPRQPPEWQTEGISAPQAARKGNSATKAALG